MHKLVTYSITAQYFSQIFLRSMIYKLVSSEKIVHTKSKS